MTKLMNVPLRPAVPDGGYVLVSEPTGPGSPLSIFAKVPPAALTVPGPAGPAGPTGPAGPAGPAGAQGAAAGATVSATPPASPTQGMLWYDTVGGQLYVRYGAVWVIAFNIAGASVSYPQLPAGVQQVPITVPWTGKPPASSSVYVPVSMALTVPANLAGTTVFAATNATANTVFAVNKISSGTTTSLGTITKTSASPTSATLAGAGGSLAVGDAIQFLTPAQDATLADCALTILGART
jgi:hypothetical protein